MSSVLTVIIRRYGNARAGRNPATRVFLIFARVTAEEGTRFFAQRIILSFESKLETINTSHTYVNPTIITIAIALRQSTKIQIQP